MKNVSLFLSLLLVFCLVLTPAASLGENTDPSPTVDTAEKNEDSNFSVRNGLKFGLSKAEVLELEGNPIEQTDDFVAHFTTVSGFNTLLGCFFNPQDELVRIMYILTSTHTSAGKYIDDYDVFQESLKSKYGKPTKTDTKWSNDLFKGEPENYGLAISLGHLEYSSEWILSDVEIQHYIGGDNYGVTHTIIYENPNTDMGTLLPATDDI